MITVSCAVFHCCEIYHLLFPLFFLIHEFMRFQLLFQSHILSFLSSFMQFSLLSYYTHVLPYFKPSLQCPFFFTSKCFSRYLNCGQHLGFVGLETWQLFQVLHFIFSCEKYHLLFSLLFLNIIIIQAYLFILNIPSSLQTLFGVTLSILFKYRFTFSAYLKCIVCFPDGFFAKKLALMVAIISI